MSIIFLIFFDYINNKLLSLKSWNENNNNLAHENKEIKGN